MGRADRHDSGAEVAAAASGGLPADLLRLARPAQWSKSVFVLIGPLYGLQDAHGWRPEQALWVALAAAAFALGSSGCYVFNDLADAEADRAHPRKRRRPIAAGRVGAGVARAWGLVLIGLGAACAGSVPGEARWLLLALLGLHVGNVLAYTAAFKGRVIVDVISLSVGFVLRVLAGCAAVEIGPSTWLLNATFFLSMFLAFGKRLGEARSLGDAAGVARAVQKKYSVDLLRMVVVVTAVATLLTYAQYVQTRDGLYEFAIGGFGFNLLWLTLLPATYGLLRAIVQLERGVFDDPTELAVHDRGFQLAALGFVALTGLAAWGGS